MPQISEKEFERLPLRAHQVRRPTHRCRSGAIARPSGRSRGAKWAVSSRLSVRERKTRRTDQPDGARGGVEHVG
jgi:hypothetical protein